ncbi:MAG TPA: DUF389 domain-containing protein [Chitinophagales bacterium]|nr:DUF389 domain-containing protein [Chitinophagales bacterium]
MKSNPIFDFFNLHEGEQEPKRVIDDVVKNISFRGANIWILACAILIASVGLNVNSTAVVIGAMLISPLMGPIVGAGFALATFDFELLKKSFKNLMIATAVSLTVSTLYFYLSPFKEVQSELLARTSPNFYDVLIAFFGGVVGAVSVTRLEKGNPIPGVAIATALMPPLCTAGFGLATFNFSYFIGAFYLYSINCFFICFSTFLVIKFLKYSPVTWVDKSYQKRIQYSFTILIFIMVLPSFYFAYDLLKQKRFSQSVEEFINTKFINKGNTLVYKKVSYNSNPKKIELAFLIEKFDSLDIARLNDDLSMFKLYNTQLVIKQNTDDLKKEILSEINAQNKSVSEKDLQIGKLQNELSTFKVGSPKLVAEIKILFPDIENIAIGNVQKYDAENEMKIETVVFYESKTIIDEAKMENWLEQKLDTDLRVMKLGAKSSAKVK